jgi:hypothetical protein
MRAINVSLLLTAAAAAALYRCTNVFKVCATAATHTAAAGGALSVLKSNSICHKAIHNQ